ncbi:transcriptional regulator [Escherichia coli]|nr:transcriptional regulator [Escherichia coli]
MKYLFFTYGHRKYRLAPGKVSEKHFNKLIEISAIHSEKVILALKDYYVVGANRKCACSRHNVSQGYFSISVRKLQKLNEMIVDIIQFYIKDVS